jgi:hypothetical protein
METREGLTGILLSAPFKIRFMFFISILATVRSGVVMPWILATAETREASKEVLTTLGAAVAAEPAKLTAGEPTAPAITATEVKTVGTVVATGETAPPTNAPALLRTLMSGTVAALDKEEPPMTGMASLVGIYDGDGDSIPDNNGGCCSRSDG